MNVKTGHATIFKNSKDVTSFFEQMSSLGLAEDMKTFVFNSQEDFVIAQKSYTKDDDSRTPTPISTKKARVPGAASTPVSPNPQAKSLSQALSTKYARFKKPEASKNVLADKVKQKLSGINGTSLKLSLFPEATHLQDQEKYQVFAIDFVENKTENTVWTHKPDAWLNVFEVDEELPSEEGGQSIDPFFYSLQQSCPRSEAKGPNVKKQIHTKNGKTVDCQLLWGMIKCTPDTEAMLKVEVLKFSLLASDKAVQEAYHEAVKNMGTSFPALLEQVMPPESSKPRYGEYWTKLNKSCTSPIKIDHHASMDEVFQDDVICSAVDFLWDTGGQSTSMWSAEMNMFAYGRT